MLSDLSITNKVFDAARIDLDIALRETLREMYMNSKSECSVGLKIKFKVIGDNYGDIVPEITYSVTSNIPVKSKMDGKLNGDFTINFRTDDVAINMASEQTSMLEGGTENNA